MEFCIYTLIKNYLLLKCQHTQTHINSYAYKDIDRLKWKNWSLFNFLRIQFLWNYLVTLQQTDVERSRKSLRITLFLFHFILCKIKRKHFVLSFVLYQSESMSCRMRMDLSSTVVILHVRKPRKVSYVRIIYW